MKFKKKKNKNAIQHGKKCMLSFLGGKGGNLKQIFRA
jgi:hypothetical protein